MKITNKKLKTYYFKGQRARTLKTVLMILQDRAILVNTQAMKVLKIKKIHWF
jgi:hypothetical protein